MALQILGENINTTLDDDIQKSFDTIENLIDIYSQMQFNSFDKELTNIGDFGEALEETCFTSISENAKDSLSLSVNPMTELHSDDELKQERSLGITRRLLSVSVVGDSHSYNVGNGFSHTTGNSTSITYLPTEKRESYSTGRSVSFRVGNSKSHTTVDTRSSTSFGDSVSITHVKNTILSRSYTGLTSSVTLRLNDFSKIQSNLTVNVTVAALFESSLTFVFFRGHFTSIQEVLVGAYCDYINYETLYRIIDFSYTLYEKSAIEKRKSYYVWNKPVAANISKQYLVHQQNYELMQRRTAVIGARLRVNVNESSETMIDDIVMV